MDEIESSITIGLEALRQGSKQNITVAEIRASSAGVADIGMVLRAVALMMHPHHERIRELEAEVVFLREQIGAA